MSHSRKDANDEVDVKTGLYFFIFLFICAHAVHLAIRFNDRFGIE